MKRYTGKAILTAAAAATACGCSNSDNGTQTQPNIVYLMFDDLGYGDLGCYGQEKIETPNIDALASAGIIFTDMYSAAPLSAPSRCCTMTGKHMGHSQIRHNDERVPYMAEYGFNTVFLNPDQQGQYPMSSDTKTIAHMMQDAGYKTAMVGKWGLGYPGSGSTPNEMGFDYFYGFNCQALAHSYYPTHLWENDKEIEIDNPFVMQGEKLPADLDSLAIESYARYEGKYYSCDLMYDKLENFIVENASSPFFAMWTTTVPHSAVQAPLDEVMYYVDKLGDEAPLTNGGNYLPRRYPHATYAAMVTHIDTQVGKLVNKLKELGVWENTIFIVTSDNGPACNGNSPLEYFQSGGPFKCCKGWGKSSLHEGGIRMPFVACWSGHIKAGSKTDHIACFADLMPTLAEISGADAPENDGISFLPTLVGKSRKQVEHEALYWEFPGAKGWLAVRIGQWKGLLQKAEDEDSVMELYNIVEDPQETTDLAAEHPEILEQMWKVIAESHEELQDAPKKFNTRINWPE